MDKAYTGWSEVRILEIWDGESQAYIILPVLVDRGLVTRPLLGICSARQLLQYITVTAKKTQKSLECENFHNPAVSGKPLEMLFSAGLLQVVL
jgi:hypothetical protein